MIAQPTKPNSDDDKEIASGLLVSVKGKIESSKDVKTKEGNSFIQTVIVMPAKDAYSHPSSFAVNSETRLGSIGAHITVPCELRSYTRKKDSEKFYNVNLWATN